MLLFRGKTRRLQEEGPVYFDTPRRPDGFVSRQAHMVMSRRRTPGRHCGKLARFRDVCACGIGGRG